MWSGIVDVNRPGSFWFHPYNRAVTRMTPPL
jgi:hypothetical protein